MGGRIVAETFIGLLYADSPSLISRPFFLPTYDLSDSQGNFRFRDLFRALLNKAGRAPGNYGGIARLVWTVWPR